MKLSEYIRQMTPEKFAREFRVKQRTAESWMRGERIPRTEQARKIVAKSPVTMDGIYSA